MLEKYTAYQANPLVEAIKYDSIDENRLFLACVQQLNPHLPNSDYYDEDFKDITVPMNEVIKFFGGNDKYYNILVEVSKKLLGKYIFIEDKEIKTFRGYTVFEYIEFGKKFGGLHFKFTNSMKPFLLDLYNKGFTGINLKEIFNLRSSYALRILELLLQYKGMANNEGNYERTFSFEKLRKILNVRGTYKNPSLFLKYVIISPISQINKKTRYTITYTVQRKGKKAIGVTLQITLPKDLPVKETIDVDIIESKSKPKQEDLSTVVQAPLEDVPKELALPEHNSLKVEKFEQQEPIKPQKKLEEYTEGEIYALEKLLHVKINERKAFEILDTYGAKAVEWAIKDYNSAKSRGVAVNNPAGFIIDKIPQYESSVPTADDIFKLAESFRAKKEKQRIKENEETERKKAEAEAKETERKVHRKEWKEWEIKLLAENFVKNGNKFSDADKKFIETKGWRTEEILRSRKYMRYFYPGSETIQSLAHKNSNEKKENH